MRWTPLVALLLAGCSTQVSGTGVAAAPPPTTTTVATTTTTTTTATTTTTTAPAKPPVEQAGNPTGKAEVPPDARAEDTSKPTRVIGDGTPASCTSQAVTTAVGQGGVITFSCGPNPVTVKLAATARTTGATVLDGGGLVTLSGGGQRRILHSEGQRLTLQNLTFADGNSADDEGGGAVFVRGGRVKVVNSRFLRNKCAANGPDLGGAALRARDQAQPVYIVSSTFQDGVCANGGALSSLAASWVVLNSVFNRNNAIGRGANPSRPGTPGGGSGGAIYLDGNRFTLRIAGTIVEDNHANEGGGAVFFVSNDNTGTMSIEGSTLQRNPSDGFETDGFRGIFFLGAGKPSVSGSTVK